jgi:D-alanyl-D-alanine carboxypeptidase
MHFRRTASCRLFMVAVLALLWLLSAATGALAGSLHQTSDAPAISARAAIVVEYPSGRILYAKAEHDHLAPASTTKILTAILALENGKLDDEFTVAPEDMVGESTMGLQAGERQTLRNLLYGMLLPSGNDAAMTVARNLGAHSPTADPALSDPVARFAEMMNARAKQMGLSDSHFVNPHGLDADGHYSSAYDLASLAWYALHFEIFNEIVRQVRYQAPGHPLLNTNEMLTRYDGADGIKTGWTDAGGLCLATSATRNGHRLISVVLNDPHWYADSTALLNYGFDKLLGGDSSGDVLGVSKRGTVSWLLVNSAPAPQQPAPAAGMTGQGGGLAPAPAVPPPVQVAPSNSVHEAQSAPPSAPLGAQLHLPSSNGTQLNLLVVLAVFATLGAGLSYTLAVRLFGWRRAAHVAALAPQPVLRRRSPNLLAHETRVGEVHIQRALALANQGRQGSSMSEFLLALRAGETLNAAQLAERYQITAGAFLALARAQLVLGMQDQAEQTLLHAVLVLPHERVLRLALAQLQSRR